VKPEKLIWILEDEEGVCFVYDEILSLRYRLKTFASLNEFLKAARDPAEEQPDLLIADLRLKEENFLNFLTAREGRVMLSIPFMVVSSVDDLDALRLCFDEGAVDYLSKPFGKGELIVKVERILARPRPTDSRGRRALMSTTPIHLDPASLRVSRGDNQSSLLTSKEFQILTLMRQAPEQTISRRDIIARIWGEVKVGSKTLDVHLFNLRKKLAPLGMEIYYTPPHFYRLLDQATKPAASE
jgi:DNA-binding response OmpR family regulator